MMKSGNAAIALASPVFHMSMYLCASASGVSLRVGAAGACAELWDGAGEAADGVGAVPVDWFRGEVAAGV